MEGWKKKVVYMDCCSFSLDGSCRKSDYGADTGCGARRCENN